MDDFSKKITEKLMLREDTSPCVFETLTGRQWTSADFASVVYALADLLEKDFSKEILVCEDNCAELMFLYFAGMFAGKVIIPIDPEKEQGEVEHICQIHPEADYLKRGELAELVKKLNYSAFPNRLDWNEVDMDSLFLITYTSGSTGEPKGVMHTAGNLFATADSFAESLEYSSAIRMGHCMPMTYMAGILNTLLMPYYVGGCTVILPRFSMKYAFDFWKTIQSAQVDTIWLSPTMLRIVNMLDKKGMMREYFHACDMKISIGTAPLDKNLREDFEAKYGIRLYQSYGLSETLFISTEVPSDEGSGNTVGKLLRGVDLVFASDGEILLDVPWMFLGYTNVDTSPYMNGKRYLTGDLGKYEGEKLTITGRKKELIVRGGYNINPRDIEKCVLEQGIATECAVISVVMKGEEAIVCCLVPAEGFDALTCNGVVVSTLGKHCRIDVFEKMKSLPKNLNGKIDKLKIKEEMSKKYGS